MSFPDHRIVAAEEENVVMEDKQYTCILLEILSPLAFLVNNTHVLLVNT